MSDAIITDLRARINKSEQPKYPKDTIIRFRVKPDDGPKRSYVAIYAGKRWWTSSTIRGQAIMSDDQFFAWLGQANVTHIELATGWEEV